METQRHDDSNCARIKECFVGHDAKFSEEEARGINVLLSSAYLEKEDGSDEASSQLPQETGTVSEKKMAMHQQQRCLDRLCDYGGMLFYCNYGVRVPVPTTFSLSKERNPSAFSIFFYR